MKTIRGWFIGMAISFPLLMGTGAVAETDLLNLSAYSEGNSPPYSENVVVGQDEKTGVKFLTEGKEGEQTGSLKFPVNLTGNFEIFIKVAKGNMDIFLTADEYKVTIDFSSGFGSEGVRLQAGKEEAQGDDKNGAWKNGTANNVKLSVTDNVAKLYVNDIFSQKLTLKPNLTYTLLLVDSISQSSSLYELKTSDSGGAPPATGNEDEKFEQGKQAGIQQCVANPASCGITVTGGSSSSGHATYNPANGEVYIPFIDVPGVFGGVQIYEVYLVQQPSTFTFDLDLGRVVLK